MGSPNLWVIRFTRVLCGRAAETALKISLTARVFPLLGGGFGGGLPILIGDGADTRGTEANSVCPWGGADRSGGTGPSAGRGNGPRCRRRPGGAGLPPAADVGGRRASAIATPAGCRRPGADPARPRACPDRRRAASGTSAGRRARGGPPRGGVAECLGCFRSPSGRRGAQATGTGSSAAMSAREKSMCSWRNLTMVQCGSAPSSNGPNSRQYSGIQRNASSSAFSRPGSSW